ncbi:MAG: hypothetical protein AAF763_19970, partial [Pseudomonadota bacterium]
MADQVPDFRVGIEAELWLRTQPRHVPQVIAARAALRVFPLLSVATARLGDRYAEDLVLPVLRALASPLLANGLKRKGEAEQARAAGSVRAAASASASAARSAPDAVDAAAIAAKAASAAASSAIYADADGLTAASLASDTADAARAVFAASDDFAAPEASRVAFTAFAAAASSDAAAFADGAPSRSVLDRPAWPSAGEPSRPATPAWASKAWTTLRAGLEARHDENWRVWTDWYQDRLDGKPSDWELERARLQPPETWEAGPKILNAAIAERLAQIEAERRAAA